MMSDAGLTHPLVRTSLVDPSKAKQKKKKSKPSAVFPGWHVGAHAHDKDFPALTTTII